MGYTVYDWFDEKFLPELKKAIRKPDMSFDNFLAILKRTLECSDVESSKIKQPLLTALLDTYDDNIDLSELIRECFGILVWADEATLNSINYTKGSTNIVAKYNIVEKD
jgi:hypothetical protein